MDPEPLTDRGADSFRLVGSDHPPAAERPVPAGVAAVAPFAAGAEHAAELFELVALQLAGAIVERRELGLLDEAAAAAAGRLLARVEHATAGQLADLVAEIARRAAVYEARLAAARARGIALPLADAFDAWRLTAVDRSILATLLGAACSPAIAQLLRCAGGTVEGTAAMLAPGHAGVLAVEERLAEDAPLARLALVAVRGAERGAARPLLERELVAAPRLAALARGASGLDEALRGATLQRRREPRIAGWAPPAVYERLRGLLAREAPLPIIWLAAARGGGAAAIAADAALSLARPALHVREASEDPAWLGALAREALLHRAALVVHPGGGPAEPSAAVSRIDPLLRRFASLPLPVVVADEHGGPGTALPALRVELPPPAAADREHLWRLALGPSDHGCDPAELAAAFRVGPEAIDRAAAHAEVVAAAAGRPIARADLVAGLRAQLPADLAPFARAAPAEAIALPAGTVDRVIDFEAAVRAHRAALALVTGPARSGKSALAALIARDVGLDLVELDALAEPRALDAGLAACELGLCLLGLDRADLAPPPLLRRLERARGPIVAMARAPVGLAHSVALALG